MSKSQLYIDENYRQHHITKELSRGGQGVVYRTADSEIAIKLEVNPTTGEIVVDKYGDKGKKYRALRLLPIPSNVNITLPISTIKDRSGYVMRLLNDMLPFEKAFDISKAVPVSNEWLEGLPEDCAEVFGKYISTGGAKRRLHAYMKAACYLAKLHSVGLVYCDISSNNMFISSDLDSSNVWLIDADNINFQKATLRNGYYTNGYGAPEVINGGGCTFYSDAYAFVVSLFWQATGTHPFKGALLEVVDDEADFEDDKEVKAYNGEFPWLGDAEDTRNAIQTLIPYECIFGANLLNLFRQMFSISGRQLCKMRPSMFQIAEQLAFAVNETIKCPHCAMDYNFFENDCCPWCDTVAISVLIVNSYYYADNVKGAKMCQYVVNITNDEIVSIPKRIISGDVIDNIDRPAFEVKVGIKCTVKNLFEFNSVKLIESNIELYGTTEINKTDFTLLVTNNNINKLVEFKVRK